MLEELEAWFRDEDPPEGGPGRMACQWLHLLNKRTLGVVLGLPCPETQGESHKGEEEDTNQKKRLSRPGGVT